MRLALTLVGAAVGVGMLYSFIVSFAIIVLVMRAPRLGGERELSKR